MKNEIESLGKELRGEKVGIETLKQIQKVKAKIIQQVVDTIEDAKNKTLGGVVSVAASWIDDAIALGTVLGKYKKIGAEWEDMDGNEAKELQEHFIFCLKEQGFDGAMDLMGLATSINKYIFDSKEFFDHLASFIKKH